MITCGTVNLEILPLISLPGKLMKYSSENDINKVKKILGIKWELGRILSKQRQIRGIGASDQMDSGIPLNAWLSMLS